MTFANFIDGGKTLVSKDLLNSEYKASVKMSELDLITFVGISKSWHAFDESRFNISFSIFAFEILLECHRNKRNWKNERHLESETLFAVIHHRWKKLMGLSIEIKQKSKGRKKFDICLSVIFSCYDQNLISGRQTGN